MKLKLLIIMPLSLALFACSNESNIKETIQPIQLQQLQKNWQLISLDNKAIQANSYFQISEGVASGNLACNNFTGTVELQENKMRINHIASTRKMCQPELNNIEMTLTSTLSSWSEIAINAQKLTLTSERHTLIYHLK